MVCLPRRTAIGSQSGIDQSLHKPLLKQKMANNNAKLQMTDQYAGY